MQKEDIICEIYYKLDMIRLLSRMSAFAMKNDEKNLGADSIELIFKEIEGKCWQISELAEKLEIF